MSLTKHIEQLCHQVSEEKDGDKLLPLVDQLNRELAGISEVPENKGDQPPLSSDREQPTKPEAA